MMDSFDQWMMDIGKPAKQKVDPKPIIHPDLQQFNEGLTATGFYVWPCCVCEKLDILPDPENFNPEDDEHYCGGSPRCCP